MSCKVSIIMPSLNVGDYIEKCLRSVSGQTLKEIEIIAVDAGSTDGTLETIEKIAKEDSRIKIVNSEIKSYGYQMNLGLKEAKGEYIGIVETDDYVEPAMFEKLYEAAKANDLDVIKSDFWFYFSKPAEKNDLYGLPKEFVNKKVFCPLKDFESPLSQSEFFNIKASIWSGIYKKSFIDENKIDFNETPGAAFQDTGFNFKVWALAKRAMLTSEAFLHYRQDNEQSSVNSSSKAYSVCAEYEKIEEFILNSNLDDDEKRVLEGIMSRLMYDAYLWNYGRLVSPLNEEFIETEAKVFKEFKEKGYLQKEFFPEHKWKAINFWMEDPKEFVKAFEKQKNKKGFSKLLGKIKSKI